MTNLKGVIQPPTAIATLMVIYFVLSCLLFLTGSYWCQWRLLWINYLIEHAWRYKVISTLDVQKIEITWNVETKIRVDVFQKPDLNKYPRTPQKSECIQIHLNVSRYPDMFIHLHIEGYPSNRWCGQILNNIQSFNPFLLYRIFFKPKVPIYIKHIKHI